MNFYFQFQTDSQTFDVISARVKCSYLIRTSSNNFSIESAGLHMMEIKNRINIGLLTLKIYIARIIFAIYNNISKDMFIVVL